MAAYHVLVPEEFRIVLRVSAQGGEVDAQELESLARQLREDLIGLGLPRVEREETGPAPEGTRGAELIAAGIGIIVTGLSTAASIAQIAEYVQNWRAAHAQRSKVEVTVSEPGVVEPEPAVRASRAALLIANAHYADPGLSGLRSPARDTEALAEVLGDPAIGGFEVERLTDAGEAVIRRRIAAFFADRDRDDVLLLHFSGHGLKDHRGRLHLAASDTEHKSLAATAIPASFVDDQMSESMSRRILLILDCCYSGAFARGSRGDSTIHIADDFGGGSGRAVLTASSATEYAFEGDRFTPLATGPSVFTGALARGMRSGEADLDGDGVITADELYEYARRAVREARTGQEPRKWISDMAGSLVVARSPRRATAATASVLPDSPAWAEPATAPVVAPAVVPGAAPVAASEAAPVATSDAAPVAASEAAPVATSGAAPVAIPGAAPVAASGAAAAPESIVPQRKSSRPRIPVMVAAALAVVLISAGTWWFLRDDGTDGGSGGSVTNGVAVLGDTGKVTGMMFGPDGSRLVTVADGEPARLWNVAAKALIRQLVPASVAAFSADGRSVAALSGGTVWTWDAASGQDKGSVELKDGGGDPVAFSPDLKTLAMRSDMGAEAYLWDTATGRKRATLAGHEGAVNLAFSPDGRWVATASALVKKSEYANSVKIWEVATGKLIHALPANLNGVQSIAFTADSGKVATGGVDRRIRLWNVADGTLLHTVGGGAHLVFDMVISPDGRFAAARGDVSSPLALFEVPTGKLVTELATGAKVFGFSPDSKRLALTAGTSVEVHDTATGAEVPGLCCHDQAITAIAISSDGRTAATVGEDRVLKLYGL